MDLGMQSVELVDRTVNVFWIEHVVAVNSPKSVVDGVDRHAGRALEFAVTSVNSLSISSSLDETTSWTRSSSS